ncbi:MAG TPA: L,D-transpeptidase family protein [Polyangium sp.]|nr:L,D-transpeptidase family protein [Polyangium sp.]
MPTAPESDPDLPRHIDETNPYEDPPISSVRSEPPASLISLELERFRQDKQLLGVAAGKRLKVGARGTGVKAVQRAFIDMGFLLPNTADGIYGKQTAKAVRNFQTHASKWFADVTATGIVDSATMSALDKLAPLEGVAGQSQHIPTPYFKGTRLRVLVVKDEHRTFLYDKQGVFRRVYMNAVGSATTPTSTGLKIISAKLDEEAAKEVGEKLWGGPVFGARILDLTWANGKRSGEELHGTISPEALGEDVSHGCIRHANPDIIAMYDELPVGAKVAIVEKATDPDLHA